jgi:hypothetical protein
LNFANVMSVTAVFIALAGTGYAATQLPKNSVGSKQLKKNAVTTAKIKNGAVTGAKVKKGTLTGTQINASTLGEVPLAAKAGDAATLEGISSSDFARSSRFLSGHAKVNETPAQTLFTVPGDFLLKTTGAGVEPKLVIEGLSPDVWDFISQEHENAWASSSLRAGEHTEVNIGAAVAGIFYAVDRTQPAKQALIDCTYEFNTFELVCTAVVSASG